jgi:hypothetical protein
MSYEVNCPDFPVSISGEMVNSVMKIFVDGSQAWEQVTATETCITGMTTSTSGVMMQMAYGSATRNGGGYLCEIEMLDGAHVDVSGADAAASAHLSYSFSIDLYRGCANR